MGAPSWLSPVSRSSVGASTLRGFGFGGVDTQGIRRESGTARCGVRQE